jgi:hypothetical protein
LFIKIETIEIEEGNALFAVVDGLLIDCVNHNAKNRMNREFQHFVE